MTLDERARELIEAEAKDPLGFWYLSYADEEKFLGAVIIEARGFVSAARLANLLKISPGGQVYGLKVPPGQVPPEHFRSRLLTLDELSQIWDMSSLGQLEGRKDDRKDG